MGSDGSGCGRGSASLQAVHAVVGAGPGGVGESLTKRRAGVALPGLQLANVRVGVEVLDGLTDAFYRKRVLY